MAYGFKEFRNALIRLTSNSIWSRISVYAFGLIKLFSLAITSKLTTSCNDFAAILKKFLKSFLESLPLPSAMFAETETAARLS